MALLHLLPVAKFRSLVVVVSPSVLIAPGAFSLVGSVWWFIVSTLYTVASSVRFACNTFTSSRISASDLPATRAAAIACAS